MGLQRVGHNWVTFTSLTKGNGAVVCQCRRLKRYRFNPWVRKIPWNRKWQPTPVFSPGKFHVQQVWLATVHEVTKSWTLLSDWAHTTKRKWLFLSLLIPVKGKGMKGLIYLFIKKTNLENKKMWGSWKISFKVTLSQEIKLWTHWK